MLLACSSRICCFFCSKSALSPSISAFESRRESENDDAGSGFFVSNPPSGGFDSPPVETRSSGWSSPESSPLSLLLSSMSLDSLLRRCADGQESEILFVIQNPSGPKQTAERHKLLTPRFPLLTDLSPPSVGPPPMAPSTPSLLDNPGRGFFSSGLDLPIVGGPSGSALAKDPFFFFPLPLRPSSSATSSFSFFFFSSVSCHDEEAHHKGNTRGQHAGALQHHHRLAKKLPGSSCRLPSASSCSLRTNSYKTAFFCGQKVHDFIKYREAAIAGRTYLIARVVPRALARGKVEIVNLLRVRGLARLPVLWQWCLQ